MAIRKKQQKQSENGFFFSCSQRPGQAIRHSQLGNQDKNLPDASQNYIKVTRYFNTPL